MGDKTKDLQETTVCKSYTVQTLICNVLGSCATEMILTRPEEHLHQCTVGLFQTVKFIAKKSKCAGLAQEIGFSAPNLCSLP